MYHVRAITQKFTVGIIPLVFVLVLGGCGAYTVPITAKPTHKIDERLLGTWVSKDTTNTTKDKIQVLKFDDSHYLVKLNDDLYRAYHSDVSKTPFITVQILVNPEPDTPKTEYAYLVCKLSDDGVLHLSVINEEIVPYETKNSASVRRILKKNLHNPALFEEDTQFIKEKPDSP